MRLIAAIAALVLLAFMTAASFCQQRLDASMSHPTYTNIQVVDDDLEPVVNHTVGIRWTPDSEVQGYTTDIAGQTPWFPRDPGEDFYLILPDGVTQKGILIGSVQTCATPFDLIPPATDLTIEVSRSMPLAKEVRVKVTDDNGDILTNIWPPDNGYPHWVIALDENSLLNFPVHAAPLLDYEAVVQFLDYRGHDEEGKLYMRGTDFVFTNNVDLGAEGIVIGIRLLGDLPEGATVDVLNIIPYVPDNQSGGITAQAERLPLKMHLLETVNDVAYIHLSGYVRKGHLAVLARSITTEPVEGEVLVVQDNPPTITFGPRGGNAPAKTCIPTKENSDHWPEPPDPWTCPIDPPSNHCGPPTLTGNLDCKVGEPQTSMTWCKIPGGTVGKTVGRTRSWKANFKLTWPIKKDVLETGGGF